MYEILYNNNYFTNFLTSSIFLIFIVFNSFLLSSLIQKKYIIFFKEFSPIVIFFLIFLCFSIFFNFLLLFQLEYLLRPTTYLITFFLLVFTISNLKKNILTFKYIIGKQKIYIIFLLVIFYLISILPISDADSLALHQYFASYIFLNGFSNLEIAKFFEFSLYMNSEILLIISPILNSDNFGSQLNLTTLIILFLINLKNKDYFILAIISCPLIIFFISTQKLQLFFSILFLVLFVITHKRLIRSKFEIFIFLSLLIFYSSAKYSYILIAIPLYIYFIILNKREYKFILFSTLISFLVILFPILFTKYFYFGNPIIPFFDTFFIDSRVIMDAFSFSVRSSEGWLLNPSDYKIYLKPFIPLSLSSLTGSLGILLLFFILDFSLFKKLYYIPLIIIILIISTGQILPRYYFESFLLLSFFYTYNKKYIVKYVIYLQSILILIFSLGYIFISYYDEKVFYNKENYMNRFSYSYFNAKILNSLNISENILTLSQDRASIFINDNIHSTRRINVLNLVNEDKLNNIINFINNYSINYIVSNNTKIIPKCISVYKIDEIFQKKAIRNFLITYNKKKFNIYKINKNNCNL